MTTPLTDEEIMNKAFEKRGSNSTFFTFEVWGLMQEARKSERERILDIIDKGNLITWEDEIDKLKKAIKQGDEDG